MRVGLVDVDGHNYPNYALMKISAWHKKRGDSVEWADAMFGEYDKIVNSIEWLIQKGYFNKEYLEE